MVLLEIIARKRDVDIRLRRIALQDFAVWTDRVPNAPLEFRHWSPCTWKAENFVPFPSIAISPCGHPHEDCEIVVDEHRYELVQM